MPYIFLKNNLLYLIVKVIYVDCFIFDEIKSLMIESVEASLFEQLLIDAPAELRFLGHCFLIDNSLNAVSGTQSRTDSVKERPCESR